MHIPESSGLGNGVAKEYHIWLQYATTVGAGREEEVLASALELDVAIRAPDWNVHFTIWLHDYIALLQAKKCHCMVHLSTVIMMTCALHVAEFHDVLL